MAKEKLREILGLDKNVMTEGDFVDAFENVVDILRDAKEVTEQEIEDLKALIKETVATLKQDSRETAESIDAKMVNVLNREVEKIETRIGVKLKEIDKKLATIKDGKDADEARVVATVLAQVPKYKMDTSEDIRNKLELLKDEDRLDKSAIRGLDNVVDEPTLNRAIEILDKRTQFLINKPSSTGGGTSVTLAGEDYLSLSGQEITANPIDIDNLSATGTPDNSTFLRGDGTWATPTGSGITLQVEGVNNTDQSLLNLVAGSNMTITDNEDGSVTFDATGGSGSPGGSDTQLQFNNAGAFGGISGATTNGTAVTFATDGLIASTMKAGTSTGILLESNNGTDVALLGAGSGAGATFYGGVNIEGLIQSTGNANITNTNNARSVALSQTTSNVGPFYSSYTQTDATQTSTTRAAAFDAIIDLPSAPGAGTELRGLQFYTTIPAANTTSASNLSITGFEANTAALKTTGDVGSITGGAYIARSSTSGSTGAISAITGTATLSGASTTSLFRGAAFLTNIAGGAGAVTVTDSMGVNINMIHASATGTVTNAYGLRLQQITNNGTIGSTYGIWTGDITNGTQTNQAYNLYLSDTNARNYIGGNTTLVGNLLLDADNTYDIGASGATRPRTGYFGTSLVSPALSSVATITGAAAGLSITTSTNGDITIDPGGSGTTTVNAGSGGVVISTDAGNSDISLSPHGAGVVDVNATLELATNSITMTGSLASTGARVTKGWFTDIESTNMPTVGGTSLSSTFLALAGGTMTGNITLGENASIALDPAGSEDGKWTGITVTGTAGYTQAFGDLVHLDPTDSRWEQVDANSAAGADGDARGTLGMVVVAGTDGNACTILLNGIIRADAKFPTLTINGKIFVSETAGAITQTAPTTTDAVIRVVGAALTADEIQFAPSSDYATRV